MNPPRPDIVKLGAALGAVAAAAVLSLNVAAGWIYRSDCLSRKGEFRECWDRALQISGLGSSGPLAAGAGIGGLVIGEIRGRKRGRDEGYQEGYWTLNPDLHSHQPDNPDG
jgi:hypothetical protein